MIHNLASRHPNQTTHVMKMRSRLLGIIALAAVSLAAIYYYRAKPEPAAALSGFAFIPAGKFTMGDSLDGDPEAAFWTPPHKVNVSAFYMGQKEVTKAEWDTVRTWAASNGYPDLAVGACKAAEHPVTDISWWDVIKWCNARSEKEELTPCYTVSGSVMKTGTAVPTVNWAANGYRLPTEAEWEKAARGGLRGERFPWGDTISHTQANFRNDGGETYQTGTTGYHPTYGTGSRPYTASVGSFTANGYGLQDMAGNVSEWCWDWFGTYTSGAQTDPRGASSGSVRVLRGGYWAVSARGCRVAYRYYYGAGPSLTGDYIGFRIARSSVPKDATEAPKSLRKAYNQMLATEEKDILRSIAVMEATVRKFCEARSIDEMLPLVRHPERVRPLMEKYYAETPLLPLGFVRKKDFQATTVGTSTSFWVFKVVVGDGSTKVLLVERESDAVYRVDWETAVTYQPMDWDRYAAEWPGGTTMDFRVQVKEDHFFSHEFADENRWSSYRLTTPTGENTLFGFAEKRNVVVEAVLRETLKATPGKPAEMILRLRLPDGLLSRRGVVIEKVMSTRWIYVVPPEP